MLRITVYSFIFLAVLYVSKIIFTTKYIDNTRNALTDSNTTNVKKDTPVIKTNAFKIKRESPITVLTVSGDIITARSVNAQSIRKNDPIWSFRNIGSILGMGDLTLINLETPLVRDCPITDEGMIFCGRTENIEGLIFSGVDIVNVANNHFGNYGLEGVYETTELLKNSGMLVSGLTNQPVYTEVNGVKFSFLGFNDIERQVGVSHTDKEIMISQISEADTNSDIVVVSFHWGDEYTALPNTRQVELAHLAIDYGADLIIGNHPHWIQGEEYYKGKYIKYAHGNTIFDQMWSEETKKGVIGVYTFKGHALDSVHFIDTYIKDYGQPVIVENR